LRTGCCALGCFFGLHIGVDFLAEFLASHHQRCALAADAFFVVALDHGF
jgi:hypothetical protein